MVIQEEFQKALKMEQEGNFPKALQIYISILEHDKSQRSVLLNLGSLYYRMNSYDQALECFMRALQLKEDYIVFFNIGSLLFRLGHYKKAIISLNQCKQLNPDFLPAVLLKGIAFSKLKHYNSALSCFKQALSYDPINKVALTALILLYYDQGAFNDAFHYLQLYKAQYTSFKFKDISSKIILQCAKNNSEIVSTSLQKFKSNTFDEYISTVSGTIINTTKGEINNKIRALEQQISNNPNPHTLLTLSLCNLFIGNSQKALHYLTQASEFTSI